MPKKIENARELLIEEAKRLLEKEGYANLTMRSVAGACGLGIGTAYNYFSSKEELVASITLEDWQRTLTQMSKSSLDGMARLEFVYTCLLKFLKKHEALFSDSKAKISYAASSQAFHKPLRKQLAQTVLPACQNEDATFLSEFIAEILLRWSVEDTPFEALAPILRKLLK